jgi:hypothetical protein
MACEVAKILLVNLYSMIPVCKYLRINNHRFQNYYNNNNFRYNTYGVDKRGELFTTKL